jgi:hypothetical protein
MMDQGEAGGIPFELAQSGGNLTLDSGLLPGPLAIEGDPSLFGLLGKVEDLGNRLAGVMVEVEPEQGIESALVLLLGFQVYFGLGLHLGELRRHRHEQAGG